MGIFDETARPTLSGECDEVAREIERDLRTQRFHLRDSGEGVQPRFSMVPLLRLVRDRHSFARLLLSL
jgi:hypothetical protein